MRSVLKIILPCLWVFLVTCVEGQIIYPAQAVDVPVFRPQFGPPPFRWNGVQTPTTLNVTFSNPSGQGRYSIAVMHGGRRDTFDTSVTDASGNQIQPNNTQLGTNEFDFRWDGQGWIDLTNVQELVLTINMAYINDPVPRSTAGGAEFFNGVTFIFLDRDMGERYGSVKILFGVVYQYDQNPAPNPPTPP